MCGVACIGVDGAAGNPTFLWEYQAPSQSSWSDLRIGDRSANVIVSDKGTLKYKCSVTNCGTATLLSSLITFSSNGRFLN